ncbi:MAG TPA: methyltransferase domain-containing protein [Arachnia sp.]|nr:methyltransferase domain-containing protein [Arachnia sp.]HMT85636.1 methyltransferase domain-containing protein [Arachnia sp.]
MHKEQRDAIVAGGGPAGPSAAPVIEDSDLAEQQSWPEVAPADYWEKRYTDAERVWSGKVNRALASIAASLPPGRSLDLGCGEGADAIWLALQGWDALGIDISPTAIRRASAAAAGVGPGRARFQTGDLSSLPDDTYELVTASFLHSPVELSREDILRRAAERVAPGGHMLITSHADFPPGATVPHGHEHRFLSPEEEVAQLALPVEEWTILLAEKRSRTTTLPDGQHAEIEDVIVLIRRVESK